MRRADAIDVVKKLFIAETCKARSTAAALATVLFDYAASGGTVPEGFTRDELTTAVSTLSKQWRLGPVYDDAVHRELARLTNRLRAFTSKHLPYMGITAITGPTGNQRGDSGGRLFLRIDYDAPPEEAPGAFVTAIGDAVGDAIGPQARSEYDARVAQGTGRVTVTEPVRNPTGRGVMLIIFLSLLTTLSLLAYPPSRRWIKQTVQRLMTGDEKPGNATRAGNTIEVRPDPTYSIFSLRVKNRETLTFSGVTSSLAEGRCTDGKAEAVLFLTTVPALKDLVLLRNDEIYRKYPNFPGGSFDFTDTQVQPQRSYVYKLAHFDPEHGEYLTSRARGVTMPRCDVNNLLPVGLSMSVEPQEGVAPLTVKCSVKATDPDGDPLTYSWTFNEGSHFESERGATAEHTFQYGGKFVATAYAGDGRDERQMVGSVDIVVDGPPPPLATPAEKVRRYGLGEVEPAAGPPGTAFRLRVLRQRNEDGARAVQYRFRLGYCASYNQKSPPPFPCVTPPQSSPEYVHTYTKAGQYDVEAEITFDNGEMEVKPIAVVNVGYEDETERRDGGYGRSIRPVGPK